LRHLVPGSLIPKDRFWLHTSKTWLFNVAMLAGLSVFYAGFVRWKIRLHR
jgi:ammonia channel protein AmtB